MWSPVRVRIDDRDIRGGEKKWQWVKRGVPMRVEIGPRDVAAGGLFLSRRDVGGKGQGVPRDEFVANVSTTLLRSSKPCSIVPRAHETRPQYKSTHSVNSKPILQRALRVVWRTATLSMELKWKPN